MPVYLVSKIQRWALILSQFEYSCSHVPGELNYFPDLMTRWGAKSVRRVYIPTPAASEVKFDSESMLRSIELAQSQMPEPERRNLSPIPKGDRTLLSSGGKLYIPKEADHLKLNLLVLAHCGEGGHRSQQVTLSKLKNKFTWKGIADDVRTFCKMCLHCAATKGSIRISRELAHAMHADHPNEIIHFDYLYLGKGKNGYSYVLIIKDDFSNYVWLIPADKFDARNVVAALSQWFATFGITPVWVSDQGSHFKNEVMLTLQRELHTRHHFTSAYHPQSNGTVEVVCREVIRALRALLSEYQLGYAEWPRFLKTVQRVLNHSPSPKLDNQSPITVFTSQSPDDSLAFIHEDPKPSPVKTLSMVQARQLVQLQSIQKAMTEMHKSVVQSAQSQRAAEVERHNRRTNVQKVNFTTGDFVLVGCPQPSKQPKLAVTWTGPARVVKLTTPQVAQVEDLTSGLVKDIHTSRLKFYEQSSLDVTEDLTDYLKYQRAALYLVDEFKELARNRRTGFKVLVSWVGFPGEDTWEPLLNLYQDEPTRVREWLHSTVDTVPDAAAAFAKLPKVAKDEKP